MASSSSSKGRILKMCMKLHSLSPRTSSLAGTRDFSSSSIRDPPPRTSDEEKEAGKTHSSQHPPHPIPNRPLRGQRPSNSQSHSATTNFTKSLNFGAKGTATPTHTASPTLQFVTDNKAHASSNNKVDDDDKAFLSRFKLNLDKNYNPNHPNTAAAATATATIPSKDGKEKNYSSNRVPLPEDADEIFKKMKETGLIPNAVAMLDGLCKDGLVQEAMKLFGLMRQKGTIPEVVVYTAVVEGFCKAQKFDDAKRIFRKMQTNGITPNAFTYTVLIQGLYKCNNFDDAIDFCIEMLEAGHSPNLVTFVGLVDGLCREKGVDEARSVIRTLREKGYFLDEKAVRVFLDKNATFSFPVWEAIFDKKPSKKTF